MKKRSLITLIITSVLMFRVCSVDVYAFSKVPGEVTEAANNGINNFKEGINESKDDFGLNSSDNVDDLELANGYECYKVSSSAQNKLKKPLEITAIDELFEASGSYIFPIKVQGKCAGIAIVEKTNNKWDVIGVSGYTKFVFGTMRALKKYSQQTSLLKNWLEFL